MSELTIGNLKKFIDNLPEEYILEFKDHDGVSHRIGDNLEIDLSLKKLILKS